MLSTRRSSRGYNLLETILACMIFSMVSVGLIGLWGNYARAMEKARHHIVASYLAEKVMEECVVLGYDLVDGKADASPVEHELQHTHKGQTIVSTYQVTVEVIPDSSGEPAKTVKVAVKWNDTTVGRTSGSPEPFSEVRSVSLETVVIQG